MIPLAITALSIAALTAGFVAWREHGRSKKPLPSSRPSEQIPYGSTFMCINGDGLLASVRWLNGDIDARMACQMLDDLEADESSDDYA